MQVLGYFPLKNKIIILITCKLLNVRFGIRQDIGICPPVY